MVLKMNFLSKHLGMQTNVTVCLPSFSFADIMEKRENVYVQGMKYQTLYLLHGGSGDDSDYVNFSNIVRYAPDAIYIIVSNPVDVMTYVFHKISGVPASRIIGSGTVLDTARLQAELAKELHISPKNVHAHVYGEHGDSSFVPWSLAHIANNHIACYKGHAPHGEEIAFSGEYEAFAEKVRTSGAVVIKAKGVTNYAIAMAVCHIVRCIFNGAGTALTISTMMNGEYGIEDVCLSVLNLVDSKGVRGKIQNDLTPEELEKLKYSASKLKETIAAITY